MDDTFDKDCMPNPNHLQEAIEETPGPWKLEPEIGNDNFGFSIYGEGYDGLLIARVGQNGFHLADAQLIRQAPELRDECERLRTRAAELEGELALLRSAREC